MKVVLTLFFLLSCAFELANAAGDCSTVTSLISSTLSACNVQSFSSLSYSTKFGASAPDLCESSCVDSLTSLYELVNSCASVASSTRTSIRKAYVQQAACSAPNPSCFKVKQELNQYVLTQTGRACFASMQAIPASGSATSQQTDASSFCTGSCGTDISAYIQKLEDHGCTQWKYYKLWKTEYSQTCAKSDTVYCGPLFSLASVSDYVRIARDHTQSSNDRTNALNNLCTACTIQQIKESLPVVNNKFPYREIDFLCTKDQGEFCFVDFDNDIRSTQNLGVDDVGRAVCQHGDCAYKMFSKIQQDPTYYSVLNLPGTLDTHMTWMCVKDTEDQLCQDLAESVATGFDASLEHQGNRYRGPDMCHTITTGGYCTWGCQRRFEVIRDGLGCCYNAMRSYLEDLQTPVAEITDAFVHIDTVATECSRPVADACTPLSNTHTFTTSVNIPYNWVDQNRDKFLSSIKSDLQSVLGRPSTGVSVEINKSNEKDDSTTSISFTVKAENAQSISRIQQTWNDLENNNQKLFPNIIAEYALRCQALSGSCSAYDLQLPAL